MDAYNFFAKIKVINDFVLEITNHETLKYKPRITKQIWVDRHVYFLHSIYHIEIFGVAHSKEVTHIFPDLESAVNHFEVNILWKELE